MIFIYGMVAFLGACLGSFSSVLITRIPAQKKWYGPERSSCPSCGNTLTAFDLVPIFSWLALKGQCRKCKARIPAFYPLLEVFCAILAVIGFWLLGMAWLLALWLLFIPVLVSGTIIYLMSINKF